MPRERYYVTAVMLQELLVAGSRSNTGDPPETGLLPRQQERVHETAMDSRKTRLGARSD
jgi:hypothetical protein